MSILRSLCVTTTASYGLFFNVSLTGAIELQDCSTIVRLQDYQLPISEARWLQSQTCSSIQVEPVPCHFLSQNSPPSEEEADEEEVIVEGQRQSTSTSPIYTITGEEIQRQGVESLTEVLRSLPGFAINDTGFGADIHTGFYYRGTTLNQNLFLLNGRSLNTNISTYHGATDLNNILTSGIDRIELLSGTAATLYGSEAFGGIVNVITKDPIGQPFRANALVQAGSYGQRNYRANLSGSANALGYALGYERFQADNDYRVPKGAANRGPDGRLFNGDVQFDNYFGQVAYRVDARNTLSLDALKPPAARDYCILAFRFSAIA